MRLTLLLSLLLLLALPARAAPIVLANIIDGADDRDALTALGPRLGLSGDEIARIRRVSGFVGCLAPTPSLGSATLFLSSGQIITAAHILVDASGKLRSKCFFKNQEARPFMTDLLLDPASIALGGPRPKAGSNADFAIVRLAAPVPDATPFPVVDADPVTGDRLIVVTAHPSGMERAVDAGMPVVQGCAVRRVPKGRDPAASTFFRTDCDATGASSGGMHLSRVDGRLTLRGITISTGPWQSGATADRLRGAPYDEARGSVTTALGANGAILAAGRRLMGR